MTFQTKINWAYFCFVERCDNSPRYSGSISRSRYRKDRLNLPLHVVGEANLVNMSPKTGKRYQKSWPRAFIVYAGVHWRLVYMYVGTTPWGNYWDAVIAHECNEIEELILHSTSRRTDCLTAFILSLLTTINTSVGRNLHAYGCKVLLLITKPSLLLVDDCSGRASWPMVILMHWSTLVARFYPSPYVRNCRTFLYAQICTDVHTLGLSDVDGELPVKLNAQLRGLKKIPR